MSVGNGLESTGFIFKRIRADSVSCPQIHSEGFVFHCLLLHSVAASSCQAGSECVSW